MNLPTDLVEGPLRWPGQHAGFLGAKHDPWQIRQDPNGPDFRVENLSLPEGLAVDRLRGRLDLLKEIDAPLARSAAGDPLAAHRERACSLLLSGRVARAFDLDREDPRLRDRYGRTKFGQSLLLSRRLVEAGVPIVQANMGSVQNWDTHSDNFSRMGSTLLPWLDRAVSALLDDLARTGLLDETLVVITGEFGRTPKVNKKAGRDHWSAVFSAAFAGAGVRGGQAIGSSDKIGAYPASRSYSPGDLAATIYGSLGVDPLHRAPRPPRPPRPPLHRRGHRPALLRLRPPKTSLSPRFSRAS